MKPMTRPSPATALFSPHWLGLAVAAVLAAALLVYPTAGKRYQDEPPKDGDKPKAEPGAVEVHFADSSVIKLKLRDDKVEIATPYGKLLVPVADIQRIQFATRVSEEDAKRIPVLIGNLGSPDFPTRDAASAELLKMGEKAYPALLLALKNKDVEVVRRATELVEKIRDTVPEENLEIRPNDVIQTADSKFTGRISTASFKATTTQFGDVTVKLADVRSLNAPGFAEPEKVVAEAPPAPQSLQGLQNQVGKTFTFTVTGQNSGAVWGTDVYTLDSYLPAAAVHAGVLKIGQTGVVKIKILESPPNFKGSTRNGITTADYQQFPGAYQILKK